MPSAQAPKPRPKNKKAAAAAPATPASTAPAATAAAVCSPSSERLYKKDGTCFNREALVKLATIWNKNYASVHGKITRVATKTKEQLWDEINKMMTKICKGSGREWCWVDKLGPDARSSAEIMKSVRPMKPREWYKKPYAWLSNYDIQAVMRQYQDDKENSYKFIGVFPLDFAAKTPFNACLYEEICKLDIVQMYQRKTKYVGMITNLDRHDEPGSHWTSLFVCIDPALPSFGAYYYDSTFTNRDTPPREITEFMLLLKQQAAQIAPGKAFRIDYNRNKHQYKNTECGIFSMIFQIRWLRKLAKNAATVFEDIVGIRMDDDDIHKLRDILFRPNTKHEVEDEGADTSRK